MKILLTAALVLLTGCASFLGAEPKITYHADTSFQDSERQCIEFAANKIAEQTNGTAAISVKYDYDTTSVSSVLTNQRHDRLVRWTSHTPAVELFDSQAEDGAKLLGQAHGNTLNTVRSPVEVRLVMDRLQDPHTCHLTAMHEFAHAFGMPHIPAPGKGFIMNPAVRTAASACFKKDELTLFAFLNELPSEHMTPCADDTLPVPTASEEDGPDDARETD